MAHVVFTNCFVSINGVDLSAHVKRVVVPLSADVVDNTTMSKAAHVRLAGLKDWSLSIDFAQDFALSQVDATLFPLLGTTFAVEVRPDAGARSTTNPGYTGTGILSDYTPITGGVGDEAVSPVSIQCSNGIAMLRQTA